MAWGAASLVLRSGVVRMEEREGGLVVARGG